MMNVVIIGMGYVGLATCVALAYLGNNVTCIDVDEKKISLLKNGILPIYEPYLKELLYLSKERISFSSDYAGVFRDTDVIFITVGTPSLQDGSPNLKFFKEAALKIGQNINDADVIIVNKSTLPIGSGNLVESLINEAFKKKHGYNKKLYIVSNPEFLREGTAIYDTLFPERIVLGYNEEFAFKKISELYSPIIKQSFSLPPFFQGIKRSINVPVVKTDLISAELIKYTANSFLALKISFINEIACISEKVGADIDDIAQAIGLDSRIGNKFLSAGIGWGGSCFGKDTAALLATAKEYGVSLHIIDAARKVNYYLRDRIVEKILEELKVLKGKKIGMLGLAFKPNTDDVRDSPGLDIAVKLIERGAKVFAHDPVAIERAKIAYEDEYLQYVTSWEEFEDLDALLLMTDWPQYKDIEWEILIKKMRQRIIFDGRNYLNKEQFEKYNVKYLGVGK